jgi:predicted Fe-Mo cluster-binding NifX family protein
MDIKDARIAIAANSPSTEGLVAERFARAPYFAIYKQEDLSFSFVKNEAVKATSGASVQAAKILLDQQIDVVLVPKLGEKAFDALEAMGIEAYECQDQPSVLDALYSFFEHQLPKIDPKSTKGQKKH